MWRVRKGDLVEAGLEFTSGIASSFFPGVGTAASFGIDATLAVRDYCNSHFYNERLRTIEYRSNELQMLSSELEKIERSSESSKMLTKISTMRMTTKI